MVKKQTQWSRNFNERAYDRLAVTIPKGRKETVERFAKEHGLSVNGLVNELLADAIGITMDEWKGKTNSTAVELASELGVSPETTRQNPKPEYKGGGSREYRNLRQEIAQNVAEMYDSNNKPEYTVNDMAEEIRVNADNFIRTITNILQVRKALLVGEGKATIKSELRKSIIDRFEEIERGI